MAAIGVGRIEGEVIAVHHREEEARLLVLKDKQSLQVRQRSIATKGADGFGAFGVTGLTRPQRAGITACLEKRKVRLFAAGFR
jgi:hypothetical protein